MPRWSVRVRILASILLVAALGMTVAGAAAFFVQRDRVIRAIDDRLLARVEAARDVVTGVPVGASGAQPDSPAPAVAYLTASSALDAVLSRILPSSNESSVGIVDGVAALVPGVDEDFRIENDDALIERIVAESVDDSVRLGTADTPIGTVRYIAAPIVVEGSADTGIFVTAFNVEAELSEVTRAFTTYAIVAVAALIGIGLVGWFVAGSLLSPIRRLGATASRITATDLSERIEVVGRDDVSELTETVNGMLDRIEESIAAQKRLLDDVRHELKTPLTIVRGHLELLDESNPDDVAATRTLAIDELDRMASLVDDIEMLAETGFAPPNLEAVAVIELATQVHARATAFAGHEWTLESHATGEVRVDRSRITQAWLQLADNASKYSPVGSPIVIGTSEFGDEIELWVQDAGPGIPAEFQSRIFERFGRVDSGRGIRGSGLGLAIVSSIAASHGGTVRLESSESGSRFGIVLSRTDADTGAAELPVSGSESRQ